MRFELENFLLNIIAILTLPILREMWLHSRRRRIEKTFAPLWSTQSLNNQLNNFFSLSLSFEHNFFLSFVHFWNKTAKMVHFWNVNASFDINAPKNCTQSINRWLCHSDYMVLFNLLTLCPISDWGILCRINTMVFVVFAIEQKLACHLPWHKIDLIWYSCSHICDMNFFFLIFSINIQFCCCFHQSIYISFEHFDDNFRLCANVFQFRIISYLMLQIRS